MYKQRAKKSAALLQRAQDMAGKAAAYAAETERLKDQVSAVLENVYSDLAPATQLSDAIDAIMQVVESALLIASTVVSNYEAQRDSLEKIFTNISALLSSVADSKGAKYNQEMQLQLVRDFEEKRKALFQYSRRLEGFVRKDDLDRFQKALMQEARR